MLRDVLLLLQLGYLTLLIAWTFPAPRITHPGAPRMSRWQRLLRWCQTLWSVLQRIQTLQSAVDREQMIRPLADIHSRKRNEVSWSKELAGRLGAAAEYRTADGSRVDILTDRCAIEVEWCRKWKESVGQALFYAQQTGRNPAVILLMEDDQLDEADYLRCLSVCAVTGIDLVVCNTKNGQADGLDRLTWQTLPEDPP